ncbi:MAG: hypothetical protein RJB39_67 [Candidatus Parcubacteria bacterium]|jgi:hypothetical protein
MYQYAYLIGNLCILLPLWLLFYFLRKDLRKELWTMSLIFGLIGPLSEVWYLQDYWHPQLFNGWIIGIEDFLFGFFIGGIAAVIYEELFSRHLYNIRKTKLSPIVFMWMILALCAGNIFFTLGLNSIYVSMVTFMLFALIIIIYRKDLLMDSLMSGILMGICFFSCYLIFLTLFPQAIDAWWKLKNISGIFVWKIPIEELLWAFGMGLMAGPLYEFVTGKVCKR